MLKLKKFWPALVLLGGGYLLLKDKSAWASAVVSQTAVGLWPGAAGNAEYMERVGGNGQAEGALGSPDGICAVLYSGTGQITLDYGRELHIQKINVFLGNAHGRTVTQTLQVAVSSDGVSWTAFGLNGGEIGADGAVRGTGKLNIRGRYVRVAQRTAGVSQAVDAVEVLHQTI